MELKYGEALLIHDIAWISEDEEIAALRNEFYVTVKMILGDDINRHLKEMDTGIEDPELGRRRRAAN